MNGTYISYIHYIDQHNVLNITGVQYICTLKNHCYYFIAKSTTRLQEQRNLDKSSLGFGFLLRLVCTNLHVEVESRALSVITKMTNYWQENKAGAVIQK